MEHQHNKNQFWIFGFAFALTIGINIFSWNKPFFWDTLLTSSITQFYYENGFGNLIPPQYLDAGHPPFFYMYVVVFYKIFGLNLFAAHFAMLLPNLLGSFALVKIMQYFKWHFNLQALGILAFFAIPAIITQQILVSYDAVLLALFLLASYCILYDKHLVLTFILIGIVAISLRGIFVNISLFLLLLFKIKYLRKTFFICLPSAIFITIWLLYHSHFSSSVFSANNDWSNQRSIASFNQIIKNSIALMRILFDFGIVLLSLIQIFQIIKAKSINQLQLFWVIPFVVFSLGFIFFSNPISHRYFLIVYVFMLLASLDFLYKNYRKFIFVFVLLPLGHFQIYGHSISNGWDCTLSHLSFFSLKKDFDNYLQQHKIKKEEIASVTPVHSSDAQYYLQKSTSRMQNVHNKDWANYKYILYSNICNDFSNEQLKKMQQLSILKQEKKGQVVMILYQNKIR